MRKILNYIDRRIAHYAHLIHGSNIPIFGGIGVNSKIARQIDSFKLEPPRESNEERIVPVFQYEAPNYPLSYSLEEMVPNEIILKIKKEPFIRRFTGATITGGLWRYSSICSQRYSYVQDKVLEEITLIGFEHAWAKDKSPFEILTNLDFIQAFLLVDQNVQHKDAIQQFLESYNATRKKKDSN